jgi:hypothetical protein
MALKIPDRAARGGRLLKVLCIYLNVLQIDWLDDFTVS